MSRHKTFVDKIYKRINFQSDVDIEDPDYHLIDRQIRTISPARLDDFYAYTVDPSHKFLTEKGYLTIGSFLQGCREFLEMESNRIWEEHGLDEKIERTMLLLEGVKRYLSSLPAEQGIRTLSDMSRRPESLKFRPSQGGDSEEEQRFSKIELEAIDVAGGLKELLSAWVSGDRGFSETRSVVESAFRTVISRRYLFGGNSAPALEHAGEEKNLPAKKRVVDLSKTFMKM